jgi:BirA family biotin operon repressor/biotin-[acetyl-CoA-carboxylase] ligase
LPDTLACLALTGSGFHGHRQRPWQALRGNLHFSSFCRIPLDAARCGPALSMLPTLAVTDALCELAGTAAHRRDAASLFRIKWVNDVFAGDRKVSGSLVATQVNGEGIESFVLGIGVNVEVAPRLDANRFPGEATSLRALGIELPLPGIFDALRQALARRLDQLGTPAGPSALFADYCRRSGVVGRAVAIHPETAASPTETPLATGRLLAIHSDLSLEIEGCPGRIRSGRLSLMGPVE